MSFLHENGIVLLSFGIVWDGKMAAEFFLHYGRETSSPSSEVKKRPCTAGASNDDIAICYALKKPFKNVTLIYF